MNEDIPPILENILFGFTIAKGEVEQQRKVAWMINQLPEDIQVKMLTQNTYLPNPHDKTRGTMLDPDVFAHVLEYFSPVAVEKATIKLVKKAEEIEEELLEIDDTWEHKRVKVPLLKSMEIANLPVEIQLKLALVDPLLSKKMSTEAKERYIRQ